MSDYPKMLYRCGGEMKVCEAFDVDTRIVASEDEELSALEEGWRASPKPPEKAKVEKKAA